MSRQSANQSEFTKDPDINPIEVAMSIVFPLIYVAFVVATILEKKMDHRTVVQQMQHTPGPVMTWFISLFAVTMLTVGLIWVPALRDAWRGEYARPMPYTCAMFTLAWCAVAVVLGPAGGMPAIVSTSGLTVLAVVTAIRRYQKSRDVKGETR